VSFTKSNKNINEKHETLLTWDGLINEALKQLAESKLRTGKLKKAVCWFKEQKRLKKKPPTGIRGLEVTS